MKEKAVADVTEDDNKALIVWSTLPNLTNELLQEVLGEDLEKEFDMAGFEELCTEKGSVTHG